MEAQVQETLSCAKEQSQWDRLLPKIKDKIEDLAARQVHQEGLDRAISCAYIIYNHLLLIEINGHNLMHIM